MKLGIQLYSVRDRLDADFTGTLHALRGMGFEGVEFAWNYGRMDPQALADFLIANGLACCGLHTSTEELLNTGSLSYQYATLLHTPGITTSYCGANQIANWPESIKLLAECGRVATSLGLRFTYHNHAPELAVQNGTPLLDALYTATDPASVYAELDTAWVLAGGADPLAYIRRYAGRLPQLHAKDYDLEKKQLVEIGRGSLDFAAIAAAAKKAGVEWLIYELDASTIGDSLASARESAAVLRPLVA